MRGAFLLLLAVSFPTLADFTGQVVHVTDGDTLHVLRGHEEIKVRLSEIDAPEKGQPFGSKSKQSLSDLCFLKQARTVGEKLDRNGRVLARVYCDGVDANEEQVRRGMAWVFDKYVTDRSLYLLQDEAMKSRRGLWFDAVPVPPWEWRSRLRTQ